MVGVWRWGCSGRYHRGQVKRATNVGRSWHEDVVPVEADDTPLSHGGRGLADGAGAVGAVDSASVSDGGGAADSSGEALGGGAVGGPLDGGPGRATVSGPVGPDDGSVGAPSAGALPADGPVDEAPADDPVDDLSADDGGGMSPVVREYTERLRREALARDAELRARGIDPYKGTPVDEEPRRRLGARALVVLVVLVAAVSVGAYVVFLRGEPDYGMSHGYQVQSDGSLKRPPVTDKAPDKPAEMSKGDEAGAAAAARYYLNASSYAWNTGDTGPLKSISDEECAFCWDQRSKIEEFYAHGYWAAGAHSSITNTQAIEREGSNYEGDVYLVQFRIDEHLAEGYTSNGFQESQSRDTVIILRVGWDGSNWRVLEGRAANAEDAM